MKLRETACFLIAVTLLGCAASTAPPKAGAPTAPRGDDTARAQSGQLAAIEQHALIVLAANDPRLAVRFHVELSEWDKRHAAVQALARNDESAALLGGTADPFAFEPRERGIATLRAGLGQLPYLAEIAPAGSPIARPRLEAELLLRMLDEERARVDAEKRLPRSASDLARGVVATWKPPTSPDEARARDTWLARRLDDVRASLQGASLRQVDVSELEDSLDPIEHLAEPAGFPSSQAALVKLRVALSGMPRGPRPGGWEELRAAMAAHLGLTSAAQELRQRITKVEADLKDEATRRLAALNETEAAKIRDRATTLILPTGRCEIAPNGSPLRTSLPPPERAPICAALHAIAWARGDAESLAALVALHDQAAMALWALDVAIDGRDPEAAAGAHPPLSSVAAEERVRWARLAATRPVLPVGVALMGEMLARSGLEERAAQAARWLAFGDAPLDVVMREL